MDQVQVEVVGAELLQRRVKVGLDVLGAVRVVPQLGRDEDVLAGNAGVLDARSDLILVAVNEGSIDMLVASLEGLCDGLLDLSRLGLPGAEAELGDLDAVVTGGG